jgi:type VI protein secretion system component VasK
MSSLFEETPQENVNTDSAEATAEANTPQAGEKSETPDVNSLFADKLQGIVTPDGRQKYADVETALDSIPHAQQKINELSDKLKQMEEELTKRSGMEELMKSVQSSQNTPETPSASSGLDEQAVAEILQNQLAQMEQAKAKEANAAKVREQLEAKFGDKAEEQFAAKAKELGVEASYLAELALTSPQLVLSHFGDVPARNAEAVTGSVNTTGLKPSAPERKSVMRGASYKDVIEQFKAHKPQ